MPTKGFLGVLGKEFVFSVVLDKIFSFASLIAARIFQFSTLLFLASFFYNAFNINFKKTQNIGNTKSATQFYCANKAIPLLGDGPSIHRAITYRDQKL